MKTKNKISKAVVLLIAAVMVLSIIPAVTSTDTSWSNEFVNKELVNQKVKPGQDPPINIVSDQLHADSIETVGGTKNSFDVLLSEGFEGVGLPTGWATWDNDGDGLNWNFDETYVAHTGSECASSDSYDAGPIDADNWMVTPMIDASGYANLELDLWDSCYTTTFPDSFEIYVSTTGNTVSDFFAGDYILTHTAGVTEPVWEELTVPLGAYDGMQFWVAICHYDYDEWTLYIDDVEITGTPAASPWCDFYVDILNLDDGPINSLPTEIQVLVGNNGPVDILEVKKLVDIYEKICGDTTEIFCDDMEDYECFVDTNNANWTVTDNGDGDTFVLQEDCFHSPGQAYRNTWGMYRDPCAEDTYLGHAADSGNDSLVLASSWDLSGAACAEISFWHSTTGEYAFDDDGNVIPIDYGTVALSFDGGLTWDELPISDFVAYNNPWTEVTIKIIDPLANDGHYGNVCDGCVCEDGDICIDADLSAATDVKIKFIWHSDPCLQFYGWCIDDVCVEVTDPYELELVFQTHSIQNISAYEERIETFPLEFTPEPDTWYQIEVCGQVFDPADCESDVDNNCDMVQFYVTDIHDMAAIDIVCPPFLNPGDSGEYTVTVKNVGNFVENNVPVDLKVSPVMAGEYINENFEGGVLPSGWFNGYFGGHNMNNWWDVRDVDANSGDYSLMMPDTGSFLLPNIDCFVSPGLVCDFSQGGSIDWMMKWSLTTDDYLRMYSHHPDGLYWFGISYDPWKNTYSNEFVEQSWDPIADTYDFIWATWPAYAPDHFPTPEFEFGWGMDSGTDMDIFHPTNPEPWTGVMIDDLVVGYEFCSDDVIVVDTVYTGVLNPGDEETFTMYWNDTQYCNWCVCAETQHPEDDNPDNDEICCKTLVASTTTDVFDYETIDLTDLGGDSLWHICCKQSFDPEPPRDCYYWNGVEFDTYGWYLPNTDDELISCTIDLSGYTTGATLIFDTWYRFGDMVDHGEIYSSGDGISWTYLGSVYGERNWHEENFAIPPGDCTANTQVKFRMYSDAEIESDGWYIDDVQIGHTEKGNLLWAEDFGEPAPPCEVVCPPGGIPEGEPCIGDYEDALDINPGCNDPSEIFSPIACGDIICGSCSVYESILGGSYRDMDWYMLEITTVPTLVTLEAETEFAGIFGFIGMLAGYDGSGDCAYTSGSFDPYAITDPCTPATVQKTITTPGLYMVVISTANWDATWRCDAAIPFNDYWLSVTCTPTAEVLNLPEQAKMSTSSIELPSMEPTDIGIPGWTETLYSGTGVWQIETQDSYNPYGHIMDDPYAEADSDEAGSGVHFDVGLFSPAIDLNGLGIVYLEYDRNYQNFAGYDEAALNVWSGTTPAFEEQLWYQDSDDPIGGVHATHVFAPGAYGDPENVHLEFYYNTGGVSTWLWSYNIDNVELYDSVSSVDFMVDNFEGDYACTWTTARAVAGDYWEFTSDTPDGASLPPCDTDGKVWFVHDYPGDGLGLNDALDVTIDLTNPELIYADVSFVHFFTIEDGCSVNIEIAGDDMVFDSYYSYTAVGSETTGAWVPEVISLADYLGQTVTLRFRYTTPGEGFVTYADFGWAVDCFNLIYKEQVYVDELPPVTVACYDEATGTVTLFAQDQAGPVVSGVCNTYYKLNGGAQTEYFPGDIITLSEGSNTLEFWSVDCAGNPESHHTETYVVDNTDPTVTITAPEDGALYLMGNKLMDRILGSGTLCIGKITIAADASDSGGINLVTFEIDGDSGYDGEAPYEYTYKQMKFGAVTCTVTAHDMKGNTAEDSIDFTIYSLGLL